MLTVGERYQVMAGVAERTPGGLTRADLRKNKRGVIVSVRKSDAAKARYPAFVDKLCAARGPATRSKSSKR